MPREALDRKIHHLFDEILTMESMVEQATTQAIDALKNRDIELAHDVIASDSEINAKRFEMENDIVVTIATEQPIMAGDLRLIASILEVVGELERMGDYAKGIAKVAVVLGKEPPVKPLIDIPRMAELTLSMLNRAILAFVQQNAEVARLIPDEDSLVDDLYIQIYRELVAIMFTRPEVIDRANHLMWVAHNLERMADRVTNICERAIYVATGELKELESSNDVTLAE